MIKKKKNLIKVKHQKVATKTEKRIKKNPKIDPPRLMKRKTKKKRRNQKMKSLKTGKEVKKKVQKKKKIKNENDPQSLYLVALVQKGNENLITNFSSYC